MASQGLGDREDKRETTGQRDLAGKLLAQMTGRKSFSSWVLRAIKASGSRGGAPRNSSGG